MLDIRVGNGFDVHAFAEGNEITLCGLKIPFSKNCWGTLMPTSAYTPLLTLFMEQLHLVISELISHQVTMLGKMLQVGFFEACGATCRRAWF